ncbi:MAG: thioredoxin domain-containing protein [Chloroflexota bacterium]
MPKNEPTGGQPPSSRHDRREASRRDRRLTAARTAAAKPAWQSPMVLLSVGAVAVGIMIVVLASGMLGGSNGGSSGNVLVPIRPTPPELIDPTNSRALGPADAPVTIEVWSDFQCPACGLFARTVEPDLVEEFVRAGTVRLVYRDLAFIDGGSPDGESQQSAAAARCAGDQGRFWQYHDYLFENQKDENKGAFRRERLDQIATAVSLDMAAYRSCMDDGDAPEQATKAETAQGTAAGVSSTPTLAINGVVQKAGALPIADLRALIAAELAKPSPAPSASAAP